MIKIITNIKMLKKKSIEVELDEAKSTIKKLRLMLLELDKKSPAPIALAAPQIGEQKRIIVFANKYSGTVMINPEIIKKSDDWMDSVECCFSLPVTLKVPVKMRRHKKIKVKYTDDAGKSNIMKFDHITCRAMQHELDHLDGKLITD